MKMRDTSYVLCKTIITRSSKDSFKTKHTDNKENSLLALVGRIDTCQACRESRRGRLKLTV